MRPRSLTRLALAGAAALAVLATATPAHAADPEVLDDGHVDAIAPRIVDGALEIQVKDGRTSQVRWLEPDTVVMHAVPESEVAVPDGDQWSFLGDPGDPFWCFPMTQKAGILWPGWSTEALTSDQVSGDVEMSLTAVEGPGTFALFMVGSLGDVAHVFNGDEPLPQSLDVPLHTHAHANWAFTAEGVYRLTFTVTAESASGEALTDTETYAVAVGDVDPTQVEPGAGSPDLEPSAPPGTEGTDDRKSSLPVFADDDTLPVRTVADDGTLPTTGTSGLLWIIGAGALLVIAGAVTLLLVRKRRKASDAEGDGAEVESSGEDFK